MLLRVWIVWNVVVADNVPDNRYPLSTAICVVKDVEPLYLISLLAVTVPLLSTTNFTTGLATLLYIYKLAPKILILPAVQVRSTAFRWEAAVILVALIVPVYPVDVNAPINDCAPFAVAFATDAVACAESAAVCAVFAAVDNVASCVVNDVLDDPYNKSVAWTVP